MKKLVWQKPKLEHIKRTQGKPSPYAIQDICENGGLAVSCSNGGYYHQGG